MTDRWFTVAEIEKETEIPDATVRRYIRNHGHHFKIKKKGKGYLIASESVEVMKKIREWYAEGKQTDQIDDKLAQTGIPMTVTVTDDEKDVTVNVAEALRRMEKSMTEINQKYDELMKAFKAQQEYIDHKLEERDQKFIAALKESMEARKQIVASEEVEQKKKWWRFW
jgi:hypothetical protein